jgi:hypothetical protein
MRSLKKHIIILIIMLFAGSANAQLFWIGATGGATYSWFSSPKVDNVITSDGWGWDFGIFARYGKRPFLQVGANWTWSLNTIYVDDDEDNIHFQNDIKFNNFNFSTKVGYELFQSPMFKVKAQAGPFIGKSMLFSSENIYFTNDDFVGPQFGIDAGAGFQLMNLVVDFEYRYHFTNLFHPINADGVPVDMGSKLQMITLKVGIMF